MAGRIPQDFIDDLIQRADIAEIIGARVQLKKAGREYKAPCPFHNEKTPSFTVSPAKGFYHCFGCGAHGTALGFLMEFDRLEFVEAIEELAQQLGVEVPRDERAENLTPVAPVYNVLAEAVRYYRTALNDSEQAIAYLKSRGLNRDIAEEFGIGFAPDSWDYLLRRFDDRPEIQRNLKAAGLIVERDGGGYYDRFRGRIVFPIRDSRGRVIGFGGRVIGDGEPKYLNSPETVAFHKGRELYGLFEARRAERKLERILVVEGYMDVVSLASNGVRNSVATLGTATTPEHLHRLFRATSNVTFCFDGDRAGRDAAWRALQTCLPEMREGRQVYFLFLPEGEDPDTVVRSEGADGLRARLGSAMPLSDYLLQELQTQTDIATMDGRARLAELSRPLLERIPPGVYRELMTDRLAQCVGMSRDKLAGLLAGDEASAPLRRPAAQPRGRSAGRPSLARQAIQLVLNYPGVAAQQPVPQGLTEVPLRGVPLLVELLEIAASRPDITPAGVLERFRERPEGPHLQALLAEEILVSPEAAATELAHSLARISASAAEQRLADLVARADRGELTEAEKQELRGLGRGDPPES